MKKDNLTGMRYGKLTCVSSFSKNKKTYWNCICDCGNKTIVYSGHLKNGHTKSCGCWSVEALISRSTTHGKTRTRLYKIYHHMNERCYSPKAINYKNYGARGIKICDEWKNDFTAFYNWAIANGYDDKLSIDRIDNDGNYEPNNCRWVTRKKQCNNRRSNRLIECNGKIQTLQEWADETNINSNTITLRLKRNWTIERALSND